MGRRRLIGRSEVEAALDRGESVSRILVREDDRSSEVAALVERARKAGVLVDVESEREMRRMSSNDVAASVLGVGGAALPKTLSALMSEDGLVLILGRLRYPGNVGFILRSAEVAGAAGGVLDHDWSKGEREEASRVSIRADRFLPVLDGDAHAAIAAARAAGRQVVAIETSAKETPWSIDLAQPTAMLFGSETEGLSPEIMSDVDRSIRIPTRGFIPSYNVQAATGILIGEWLRQTHAD